MVNEHIASAQTSTAVSSRSASLKQVDDGTLQNPPVSTAKSIDPSAQPPSEKSPEPTTSTGPSPPPDGGTLAWLQVLSAFLLWFNSWGILNTFGVFQTYYESGQLFTASSSNISWIGAIQSFLVLLIGFFSGPMYDRGHLRLLIGGGSFLVVFGHMMLSLCKEFWQVLLAQGFCVGIGAGCLFVPSVSILPTYFRRRLGLAVGLGSSGSSLGGIIYPVVAYRLIDRIGFAWSVRVMGFIALATLLVPNIFMRMRVKPPNPRALIDWTAFVDVPYIVFVVATLIGFIGLSVILFYLSYAAQAQHITDTSLSFYLVSIFNGASTFGRIAPNALSDIVGPFNLLAPCALISGVLILCMIVVKSKAAIIVAAILIGFFSGVFIAMPPVCFVALINDKSKIGTRVGMGFGIIAFGMLAGGPGAGAILGTQTDPHWASLWVYGGVTACVSGLIYIGLRVARGGFNLVSKA